MRRVTGSVLSSNDVSDAAESGPDGEEHFNDWLNSFLTSKVEVNTSKRTNREVLLLWK